MKEKIAVIGLGYVGLPLLVGLARHFDHVVGFDIDHRRIEALRGGHDWTDEVEDQSLIGLQAHFTDKVEDLSDCSFFIATVPTPIDQAKRPDLGPVLGACKTIGEALRLRQDKKPVLLPLIVFESTVYPGLTEDVCGSEIETLSGLKQHHDFKLGYSPERINPGDKVNRLETITKVISAEDDASLKRMAYVYGQVIENGLHHAPNIRVAEAAKVLENTQRDLNVALMNELAIICERIGIRTHDVLAAAGTKWNFLKFSPGLVGGHCIGVDPYYLTYRAEELGYNPQVILAGRRINDHMPVFLAQKIVKLMIGNGAMRPKARVGILGLTFKENVRDIRNSRVPDIIKELEAFGVTVLIHDPMVDAVHAEHEYGLKIVDRHQMKDLDALVLAVPHRLLTQDIESLWSDIRPNGLFVDVKSVIEPSRLPQGLHYWSL